MSREIRFRAFDSRSSKMYDFAVIGFNGSIHVHADDWDKTHQWLDIGCGCDLYDDYDGEVSILQFTGLKDRNGVDIYEGDVLKAHGIVVWNNEEHRWSAIDIAWNDKREWHDLDYLTSPFEVIGNIHQHPELLEVKS